MGAGALLIADGNTWAIRNGWVFWLGFFAAAMMITYFAVALLDKKSILLHVCAGAALVAVLSACFVLGAVLPSALNLGDRDIADPRDSEVPFESALIGSAIVGALLGGPTGFIRGWIDRAGDKAASVSRAGESRSHLL